MELLVGIEPTTCSLRVNRSTIEPQKRIVYLIILILFNLRLETAPQFLQASASMIEISFLPPKAGVLFAYALVIGTKTTSV